MLQAGPSHPNRRPLVSVVVPNYNGREMLETCLKALQKMRSPRGGFEIVVVCNGSHDGSQELVRRKFKSVRLLSLDTNLGFATAVNLGVSASKGEFVAIVNNDVELTADWLTQLLAIFSEDPSVGAATGKLLFKRLPKIVNDLGGTMLLNGAGLQRGLGIPDVETQVTTLVGVPSGAACLIRKKDFLEAGGFDDHYFTYFEDVDLGWRLWQRGRKVICVPRAVAYHVWRFTAMKFGMQFRAYHGSKNSFANFVKNTQTRYLPEAALLWTIRLLIHIILSIKTGDANVTLANFKAIRWCVRNLRILLLSRRAVQLHRKVSDTELVKLGVLGGLRRVLAETLGKRFLSLTLLGGASETVNLEL